MFFSLERIFVYPQGKGIEIIGNEKDYKIIFDSFLSLDNENDLITFLNSESTGFISNGEHKFSKNNYDHTTTIEDGFDETGTMKVTVTTNNLVELMLAYIVLEKKEHLAKIIYKKNDHLFLEGFSVVKNTQQKPEECAELLNYKKLGYFVSNFNTTEFRMISTFLELYLNEGIDNHNLLSWCNNEIATQEHRYFDFYVKKNEGTIIIGTNAYDESPWPEYKNQTWYVILLPDQFKNLISQWCVLAQKNIPHIILCKHDNEYAFEVPQQPDSIEEFKTYVVPLTSEELTREFAQFRYFEALTTYKCIKATSDQCYAIILFLQNMVAKSSFEGFLQWLNNGAQERYEIQYCGYIIKEKLGLLKIHKYNDFYCSTENFITIAQQWYEASMKKTPLVNLELKDGSFILTHQLDA